MKLKQEFITHKSGDEQMMIDASGTFNGLVRSNKTAAYIVELLKKDTTENTIVHEMMKRYDAPEEIIRADVMKILDVLKSIGALDE